MKSTYTLINSILAALFLIFCSSTQAQPTAGTGMAPGSGYGTGLGNGGTGMGQGNRRGRGFTFNSNNAGGWSLMTQEERTAHRDKMFSAKNYDECKTIQEEQHKAMIERAKVQGTHLLTPRQNGCDRMKARGFFK